MLLKPFLRLLSISILILFVVVISTQAQNTGFVDVKQTTVSNVGMTVYNLGLVGNAFQDLFQDGMPSAEYPVGSGIEHIFQGGLWFGGIVGGQQRVTTGAMDASSGFSVGASNFEFTAPQGSRLRERSVLFESAYYDPNAVSHQDFVADFTDKNVLVPGTNRLIPNHIPLNIDVHFEAYNWNFSFVDFLVILTYNITNVGKDTIRNPQVGYWVDQVVRNVNITRPGGTPFYDKGGNGYLDTNGVYMAYEFDAEGDVGFTDSYNGVMVLGSEQGGKLLTPDLDTNNKINFQIWQYRSPLGKFKTPESELERWQRLSGVGLNYQTDWPTTQEQIRSNSNRVTLLSTGPFNDLMPDSSITVHFGIVFAPKFDDGKHNREDTWEQKTNLLRNAEWALRAFYGEDANRNGQMDLGEDLNENGQLDKYILPTPPNIPRTKFVARQNAIDIYWDKRAEETIDPISKEKDFEGYKVYKSKLGFDVQQSIDVLGSLDLIKSWDIKGNGLFFDNGMDDITLPEPVTFEGDTNTYYYKYTIDNVQDGWQHAIALTAFDRGDKENDLGSLESSQLANLRRVFPGKPANNNLKSNKPFVYPNPYYGNAAWEGQSTRLEDKKLIFANLPKNAFVRIYNTSGDLIDSFRHTPQYQGNDALWFNTYSDPKETVFSGGEHAWDLISANFQIIARGMYLFSVEDLDTGEVSSGKFVIIK